MKKIGFIDYSVNNWHAENYPKLIQESSYKDKFEIALVWEEAPESADSLEKYCKKHNLMPASGLKQVVDECDCICVLSPRNPERHEDLSAYALSCGKPVYIDKPFAPSAEVAKRIVKKAKDYKAPLMSSSALRFDSTMEQAADKIGGQPVNFMSIRGGGDFDIYAIHQVEMLAALMGTGASRVMQCGNEQNKLILVDYPDNRRAVLNLIPGHPFQFSVQYGEKSSLTMTNVTDYFPRFVEAMLKFFDTRQSSVPVEQTIEIAAILEAATTALKNCGQWADVPR